ncbi:MAG TPA: CopG family transcriptional regulator [Terracidiphilus sp.]|nr:CopG family transcriptional regulator [Terracidiphilus sp.]
MKVANGNGTSMKGQSAGTVRASISFPSDIYQSLEELAKRKKVSLAWVVRDAAEKYVGGWTVELEKLGLKG